MFRFGTSALTSVLLGQLHAKPRSKKTWRIASSAFRH
ncbi:hypothetical protein PSPO01_09437 [Paraphaeosphaeria sporulosa]